jgi:cytochrome c oxidase assembly protein subunit 15
MPAARHGERSDMSVAGSTTRSEAGMGLVFARLALAASTLTLLVIVASAFIRHTQAGLACSDWPACYAAVDRHAEAASATGVSIARIFHRLAATSALVLVVGLWLSARVRGPEFRHVRTLALAASLVAGALGVLGVATPAAAIPAVPLGNLIGGYLMLAMLAGLFGAAIDIELPVADHAGAPSRRRFALALLALAFVQASIGGLIGTRFALTACAEVFRCPAAEASAIGTTLDPFQKLVVGDGHVVPPAGAAALHIIHRMLGIAVAAFTLLLAYRLRRTHARTSLLLAGLALAAPLLGVAAVLAIPALAITVSHNAAAAVLVATLAYVAGRTRWAEAPEPDHTRTTMSAT